MQLAKHRSMTGCCLLILFTIVVFVGCGGGDKSAGTDGRYHSATLTFLLDFTSSANPALGEPDICRDYHIDTIAVQVYRAADNSEVAAAQSECSDHSLTVTKVPPDEKLYAVCKGNVGTQTAWQGQKNSIIAKAGQNTDVGIIDMTYVGDDTEPPEIISTYPADDTADVDLNVWILVTFNEPLAPSTIPDNAITVMAGDTQAPGQVSYDPAAFSIRFTPTGLDPETTYTATIKSQDANSPINDIAGQPFSGSASWQFTTRGATDTAAPQVVSVSPANGSLDVAQQTAIEVQFSEPMDSDTLTDGVIVLSSDQGAVKGQLKYNDSSGTLTFTPELSLNSATQYSAVVTTQAQDTGQNPLQEPFTWQFKTVGSTYTLNVTRSGSGNGTVVSTPAAIDCGNTCQAVLEASATITLEATADESSTFSDWSGDACVGDTGPCTFTMSANMTVSANFSLQRDYTIDVSVTPADGSGGAISPSGTNVEHGDDVSFEIMANPYYHLSELLIDGNPETLTDTYQFENVTQNHTIQATFKTNAKQLFGDRFDQVSQLQINADGRMVWQAREGSNSKYDIYFWDGSFPPEAINISQDQTSDEFSPKINARGQVIWEKRAPSLDYEIMYWDGLSPPNPRNISDDSTLKDVQPSINSKGQVVWSKLTDLDAEMYYWDGKFPPNRKKITNDLDNDDSFPIINAKGHVLWRKIKSSYQQEIYYWDGTFPPDLIKVSIIGSGRMHSHSINPEGQVVWGAGDYVLKGPIHYWDGTFPLNPVVVSTDTSRDDKNPRINANGQLVWKGSAGSDSEIHYWDGLTPIENNNISNHPNIKDVNPIINATGSVIWYGEGNIYYYNITSSSEPIIISEDMEHTGGYQINDAGQVVWSTGQTTSTFDKIFLTCIEYCSSESIANLMSE